MAYKKSKRILRYFLISLGSAMGCIVVMTIFFVILSGGIDNHLRETKELRTIILENIIVGAVFGLPVALPAAMIMGGVMLALQERYSIFKKDGIWIMAGIISSASISIFFPIMHPSFLNIIWSSMGGATGAWVFLKLWRRYPLPPLPDNTQI